MVWRHVTHGELRLAPRPIRDRKPANVGTQWIKQEVCSAGYARFVKTTSPVFTLLRHQVTAYALELAVQVDTGWQPSRPSFN